MDIEVRYSEEQQKLLDEATKQLRDYEELLVKEIRQLKKDPILMRETFMNDAYRKALIEHLVHLKMIMLPTQFIRI